MTEFEIRRAQLDDIAPMLVLFEDEVRAGRMLPRHVDEVTANLADWLVAVRNRQIIGCVSLVFFNRELCEIRSLAVHPHFRRHGLGSALINTALELARQRDMRRVLALTRSPNLFERLGFQYAQVAGFPEKVWQDCSPCPFRDCCDEVALVNSLDSLHPPEIWSSS